MYYIPTERKNWEGLTMGRPMHMLKSEKYAYTNIRLMKGRGSTMSDGAGAFLIPKSATMITWNIIRPVMS